MKGVGFHTGPRDPDRAEKIAALAAEGMTLAAIADRFGVSRSTISGALHRHRLADGKAPPSRTKDPDRDAEIGRMWVAGQSYGEIAKALLMNRNVVIGIVRYHRAEWGPQAVTGLQRRPVERSKKAVVAPRAAPATPRADPLPEPVPAVGLVAFSARKPRECTMPTWPHYGPLPKVDDLMVCGRPVEGEAVYCAAHCRVAYMPALKRGDRPAVRT